MFRYCSLTLIVFFACSCLVLVLTLLLIFVILVLDFVGGGDVVIPPPFSLVFIDGVGADSSWENPLSA